MNKLAIEQIIRNSDSVTISFTNRFIKPVTFSVPDITVTGMEWDAVYDEWNIVFIGETIISAFDVRVLPTVTNISINPVLTEAVRRKHLEYIARNNATHWTIGMTLEAAGKLLVNPKSAVAILAQAMTCPYCDNPITALKKTVFSDSYMETGGLSERSYARKYSFDMCLGQPLKSGYVVEEANHMLHVAQENNDVTGILSTGKPFTVSVDGVHGEDWVAAWNEDYLLVICKGMGDKVCLYPSSRIKSVPNAVQTTYHSLKNTIRTCKYGSTIREVMDIVLKEHELLKEVGQEVTAMATVSSDSKMLTIKLGDGYECVVYALPGDKITASTNADCSVIRLYSQNKFTVYLRDGLGIKEDVDLAHCLNRLRATPNDISNVKGILKFGATETPFTLVEPESVPVVETVEEATAIIEDYLADGSQMKFEATFDSNDPDKLLTIDLMSKAVNSADVDGDTCKCLTCRTKRILSRSGKKQAEKKEWMGGIDKAWLTARMMPRTTHLFPISGLPRRQKAMDKQLDTASVYALKETRKLMDKVNAAKEIFASVKESKYIAEVSTNGTYLHVRLNGEEAGHTIAGNFLKNLNDKGMKCVYNHDYVIMYNVDESVAFKRQGTSIVKDIVRTGLLRELMVPNHLSLITDIFNTVLGNEY